MRNMLKKIRTGMATSSLLALFLSTMSGCVKDPEVSGLTRNTDELTVPYNQSVQTFTVRNNGPWSVSSDADWLTFSPAEGGGRRNQLRICLCDGRTQHR